MALFGNDRPVMPSFKTAPELDSSTRGPYDDLNRLERNGDRAPERNGNGASERNQARQLDRADDRNPADLRAQDRLERVLERNGKDLERELDRNTDRHLDREPEREPEGAAPPPRAVLQASRKTAEPTHPLIEGLFSKLPQPEVEWPLAARQKWLQTAASIFDLMYAPNNTDAGELSIRVERTPAR
ncbi:MAG TPA: hypothetical protein VE218_08810 [Acidobacteriaceae bacterium]|nr:hypothetical protein [Acidobacteriaceae bacterium]